MATSIQIMACLTPATRQTAIWYLSGPTLIGSAFGPTPPSGWVLMAIADFNGNGKPDYVLYNVGTRQTAIWYLNNNVYHQRRVRPHSSDRLGTRVWRISMAMATQITPCSTRLLAKQQSGICQDQRSSAALFGPTLPSGWALVATNDFNGNGKPDYVLYNAGTRQTAIWYLNNNVFVSGASAKFSGWLESGRAVSAQPSLYP